MLVQILRISSSGEAKDTGIHRACICIHTRSDIIVDLAYQPDNIKYFLSISWTITQVLFIPTSAVLVQQLILAALADYSSFLLPLSLDIAPLHVW